MQAAKNTIVLQNNTAIVIAKKERPYNYTFVVQRVLKETDTELECVVQCAADADGPGRVFYCNYTLQGRLLEAFTLN